MDYFSLLQQFISSCANLRLSHLVADISNLSSVFAFSLDLNWVYLFDTDVM